MKRTSSRKKACKQCTDSKARCDLERPTCSRCAFRNLYCRYTTLGGSTFNFSPQPTNELGIPSPSSLASPPDQNNAVVSQNSPRIQNEETDSRLIRPDFSKIDLVSNTDSTQIGSRWLEYFIPSSNQRPKALQPYTIQYLSCVLRTYPKCMLRPGGLPPIIHPLQIKGQQMPLPLANCYSLIRMWEGRETGSEAIVTATVQREMARLLEEHQTYGQMELLAAFQAFIIYAIMAFFSPAEGIGLVNQTTMAHLQELASRVSTTGLVCAAELSRSRPQWESWIVASTKRRAIYTMYLFNSIFNTVNSVPVYIAEELRGLPAPASKVLWEACTRSIWEREYDHHLSIWEGEELYISELWRSPETGSPERRKRIDRWVQSVDEFGMMMFAVCAHIHGC